MEYRTLGRSGLKVSTVGFGSWLTVGADVDVAQTERIVKTAFDSGINLFDTADVYAHGEAERTLGRAIAGMVRHHLVLATKCFFPMSDDVNDRGLSRKHVFESCHHSLRRLSTDYVDLYQCHRPDPATPLEETCRAMDDLIRQGKVLYWGTSAWPAEELERAVALCRANGWDAPISNQPCYNLLERAIEADVLPVGAAAGLGHIVYSPLAQGVLTGKYRPGQPPPAGSRATDERGARFIGRFLGEDQLRRVARLVELAERHGTTPIHLALAFCLRRPEVASVIVGARSEAQLRDSLGAGDYRLEPALIDELEALFPA